jgi:PAS domain S-box-containing protein
MLLLQSPVSAQVKQIRRVVILNDLGVVASPGYAEIDRAIFAGLQNSTYQIELYQESLEVTLFPDEVSQRRFREEFIQKYSDRKPDVIIAVGSESLKFIAESREQFLSDTPVIFCAVIGKIPGKLRPDGHFTGVVGRLHPEETLTTALHMFPDTKHVVVTGGMGTFDEAFEDSAKEGFQNYQSKLEFTYLTNLTMPALLERLKHLPSNTIVYHTAITKDAAGQRFIDSAQSVPLVASAANAPIFVMDNVDLRGGVLGGDLVNWSSDARVAAEMAVRVFNGEKLQDIPIVTSGDAYMFDWRALQRWGIRESDLPPGSVLLNRTPNFWQLYKRYVLAGVFVLLAQTVAILALLWQRSRRIRIETELVRTNERLRLSMESGRSVGWETDIANQRAHWFGDLRDIFGTSSNSFDGKDNEFQRYVHFEDREHVSKALDDARQNRAPFSEEFRIVQPNGEVRWIVSRGKFEYAKNGEALRMLGMAVDITERKRAEEALSSVSRRIIEAHEEERTRIARELHDDINQRLALLAVSLSNLKQKVPASEALKAHVEQVREDVFSLGKDVQALSHRLHSSKLEYLGLAAAARGFCQEFSEQNHVEIEFHCGDIPRSLPSEISVSLFRVMQEALQNAAKHSGTRRFEATLERTSDEIQLCIHDSGVGFDTESTNHQQGLGLVSMAERLKLVGGQLFIDSKPQCGTTIRARVPLNSSMKSAAAHA